MYIISKILTFTAFFLTDVLNIDRVLICQVGNRWSTFSVFAPLPVVLPEYISAALGHYELSGRHGRAVLLIKNCRFGINLLWSGTAPSLQERKLFLRECKGQIVWLPAKLINLKVISPPNRFGQKIELVFDRN